MYVFPHFNISLPCDLCIALLLPLPSLNSSLGTVIPALSGFMNKEHLIKRKPNKNT